MTTFNTTSMAEKIRQDGRTVRVDSPSGNFTGTVIDVRFADFETCQVVFELDINDPLNLWLAFRTYTGESGANDEIEDLVGEKRYFDDMMDLFGDFAFSDPHPLLGTRAKLETWNDEDGKGYFCIVTEVIKIEE